MSAELEQFEDGSVAFAAAREPGWHNLGTVVPDAMTSEEALTLAHLNWQVQKFPAFAQVVGDDGASQWVPIPGKFGTVRQNPVSQAWDGLGVVGKRYEPFQQAEVFGMVDLIVDEYGAHIETAGSLYGGRRVFMTLKMPDGMRFGGVDPVDLYLLATNSHDGSSALTFAVVPLRVVCSNTLSIALRSAKRTFTLRHTKASRARIEEVRTALDLTTAYVDAFEKEVAALIDEQMTQDEFNAMVDTLLPLPRNTRRSATILEHKRDGLKALWGAETQDNVRGTKWGAWNAVTEWSDWFAPVKGKNREARRAEKALVNPPAVKTAALKLLRG